MRLPGLVRKLRQPTCFWFLDRNLNTLAGIDE
jgi:hypothetical protein